jgi:hypothetical protein
MDERVKQVGIVAVAGILLAAFAYAGYGVHQKRELRARVVEAVATASRQMDETLVVDVIAPPAGLAERLEAKVAQADGALQKFRALGVRRDPDLVEAADPYMANALEVLRRQAGAVRHRARFIEDRDALKEHLARVGTRSENWAAEAIRLRKQLEEDNFSYQLTVASLGNMLAGLLDARRKIAAQLPAVPLPEEAALVRARERSLAAAGTATQELENVRRLVTPG